MKILMLVLVAGIAVPALAQTPPGPMPYTAIHRPEFVAASEAMFLHDDASSVIDLDTRSTWSAYGLCLEGPLRGTQLKQVILVPQFWFAWSQFRPGTRVFTAR